MAALGSAPATPAGRLHDAEHGEAADDHREGEREDADGEPDPEAHAVASGRLRVGPRALRACAVLVAAGGFGGHVFQLYPGHGCGAPSSGFRHRRGDMPGVGDGRLAAARARSRHRAQRDLVERRDLARGERLEPEMVLVAGDELLEPPRLAEDAPLRSRKAIASRSLAIARMEAGDLAAAFSVSCFRL